MFVVATPEQSEALLEELADIEKEMFTELGLHFKILVWPFSVLHVEATLSVSRMYLAHESVIIIINIIIIIICV